MDGPGDHYMNIPVLPSKYFALPHMQKLYVCMYVLHSSILSVYIKRTL